MLRRGHCLVTRRLQTGKGELMTQSTYVVTGMTCGHCVASVKEEVGELSGVRAVDVDLASGRVLVTSDGALAPEQVEGAVRVAGYQLVR